MAKLKDTTIDGNVDISGDVTLQNRMAVHGVATDGSVRENLQPCNQVNNCVIGYGNYAADNGTTNIYGKGVKMITQDNDVTVDDIQIARVDEATCTLASGWSMYTSGDSVWVSRYGKVVTLVGAIKNNSTMTINTTKVKIFTVPAGYRPKHFVTVVCQGSSYNKWVLTVNADGSAHAQRYGVDSYPEIPAGAWFPFHATWIIP